MDACGVRGPLGTWCRNGTDDLLAGCLRLAALSLFTRSPCTYCAYLLPLPAARHLPSPCAQPSAVCVRPPRHKCCVGFILFFGLVKTTPDRNLVRVDFKSITCFRVKPITRMCGLIVYGLIVSCVDSSSINRISSSIQDHYICIKPSGGKNTKITVLFI